MLENSFQVIDIYWFTTCHCGNCSTLYGTALNITKRSSSPVFIIFLLSLLATPYLPQDHIHQCSKFPVTCPNNCSCLVPRERVRIITIILTVSLQLNFFRLWTYPQKKERKLFSWLKDRFSMCLSQIRFKNSWKSEIFFPEHKCLSIRGNHLDCFLC